MDNLVLEALIREWRERLVSAGFGRIYYYRDTGYYIQLYNVSEKYLQAGLSSPFLGTRIAPERPDRPSEITPLLLQMRKEIEGAFIKDFEKPAGERLVKILLGKSRQGKIHEYTLVMEFISKRGNLILLNAENEILGIDHPITGERNLDTGEIYEYPEQRSGFSLDSITREEFINLIERTKEEGETLSAVFASEIFGLGSIAARELASASISSTESGWKYLTKIKDMSSGGKYKPTLYSAENRSFVFVLQNLKEASVMKTTSFKSVSDALSQDFEQTLEATEVSRLKGELNSFVKKKIKSLKKLILNLEKELAKFSDFEKYKIWGELIVSNMHSLDRKSDIIKVVNYYSEDQEEIEIPIDQSKTLQANAEKLFNRHRKYKRGLQTVTHRLKKSKKELEELKQIKNKVSDNSLDDLQMLRSALSQYGYSVKKQAQKKSGKKESRIPYRKFLSSDGMEILVGRGSKDNDEVTFKYGKDLDFWMHVAGSPGSHVIIKNPEKLEKCPENTILEAAALAAFFSKQRKNSKVQVHLTQRKHVKRIKGAPPGKVKLMGYTGLLTEPAIPETVKEDND